MSEKKTIEPIEVELTKKQEIALQKTISQISYHEKELERSRVDQNELLELILEFNKVESAKGVEIVGNKLKITV